MLLRALTTLALCLVSSCTAPKPSPDALRVTFLDVGQADCAVLQAPDGTAVVFDTGSGSRSARLLRERGIRTIDLIVVSHPHDDHIGGLRSIVREFPVKRIWHSGLDLHESTRLFLERNKAEIVRAGARVNLSGVDLTVLHPSEPATAGELENNNSLVVRAEFKGTSYLFTGDCELECWESMFRRDRAALRSDVLKAAHHGADNGTNSGVLINVRPSVFVISCGRNNRYGHPDDLVLRLASKLGARTFRTDQLGTISCAGLDCRGERFAIASD